MTDIDSLREYLEKSVNERLQIQYLASFVGASPYTIRTWLSGKNKPIGLVLIKLKSFLQIVGCGFEDLSGPGEVSSKLRDLVVFAGVGIHELQTRLNISRDSVMRLIREDANTSEHNKGVISILYDQNLTKIDEAKMVLRNNFNSPSVVTDSQGDDLDSQFDLNVEGIAHMITGLVSLLEANVDNEHFRHQLRGGVSNEIYKLSSLSSRLCSEKANKMLNPGCN